MSDGQVAKGVSSGDARVRITAAAIAEQVGGNVVGDADAVVVAIAPLDRAGPSDLSFLAHARYVGWFVTSQAGVVLVSPDLANTIGSPRTRVVVDKPIQAMLRLLAHFRREEPRPIGVHPTALVAPTATLGDGVTIEAYAIIGDGVTLGDRAWIGSHAVVGEGTTIGRDVRFYSHAMTYAFVEIGDRVVLHAGARVGRDGFGFVQSDGGLVRVPHPGRCVLEDDVEIGANSCVDRGSVDDTIIGAASKLDSLVHVAHNVRIGKGCFFAAGVGIAGSSRIGDYVQFGGQSGVGGHVNIGDRVSVAAKAGVISDVPAGSTVSGFPARPHREQLRSWSALARLGKIIRPLEQMLADRADL